MGVTLRGSPLLPIRKEKKMTYLRLGVYGKDEGIDFRQCSKISIVQTILSQDLIRVHPKTWEDLALKESRVLLYSTAEEREKLKDIISFLCEVYPHLFERGFDKVDYNKTLAVLRDWGCKVSTLPTDQYIDIPGVSFNITDVCVDGILLDGYTIPAGIHLSSQGILKQSSTLYTYAHMTDNDIEDEINDYNRELPELKQLLLELAEANGFPTEDIHNLSEKGWEE